MKKLRKIILVAIVLLGISFFYIRNQVLYSHGEYAGKKIFEIRKGEGNAQISTNLKREGLISEKWYFIYYIRSRKLSNRLLPGKYELSGSMAIPEIATYLTQEENILPGYVKITFPEGWIAKKMAERLNENGLDGSGFLKLIDKPEEFKDFDFLKDKNIKSLEGFLFPDTYFFAKDLDARGIIGKILKNFDNRLTSEIREKMADRKRTIFESIIIASIIEREVRSLEDRKIVAGIIENRLSVGQALQCDSTLAYILENNKKQYSFAESRTPSPYNTYINRGLPPGPISNPGMSAIMAVVEPTDTQFNYFLNDPETGETVFARNFEEHKLNKTKHGL